MVILLYQTWWYCYITHGDIIGLCDVTRWRDIAWVSISEKMTFETLSKAGRVKTDKRYPGNLFQIFDAADENDFDVELEHFDNEEEDRSARTVACMMRLKWDCWVTAWARVC